ncbi:MAG: ABC transporter ATP-binding protein [Acidimicrobiales bacterium]
MAEGLVCGEVRVQFEGVPALDGVTMTVARGEVVGLIGPNGAGKTTVVNVLSGFVRASSGTVTLDGRELSSESPETRARLGLARTFQHGRLFAALSVRENVELGALAVGASRRTARARATRLLRDLHLEVHAGTPAGDLSHGDQQRVSVVRAVAMDPTYLLLDEPAAGLPEGSMSELRWVVEEATTESGAGVMLIDHNVDFVLQTSDRVVVLDHGHVIAAGTPDTIRRNVDVVSAYLGESGIEDRASNGAG